MYGVKASDLLLSLKGESLLHSGGFYSFQTIPAWTDSGIPICNGTKPRKPEQPDLRKGQAFSLWIQM